MAILEQVMNMKRQGIPDGNIISELSQQGISPREISEALKQAQIKNAISNPEEEEEMQPSIMTDGEEAPAPLENTSVYAPQDYGQQEQYAPAPQQDTYLPYPQEEPYPQEQYYQPGEYEQYASTGIDTSTVMEVADQVFSDRIRKTQKQVDNLTENSTLLQTRVENISDRLKKIETMIDKLQIAILEKIGSYGGNLESIKKEMSMMQDSFSKMISPLRRVEKRGLEENFRLSESGEPASFEIPGETRKRTPRKKSSS